jgi:hypothetical protein
MDFVEGYFRVGFMVLLRVVWKGFIMNKKEFSKWLEQVEKDISSKEIVLDDLQLSASRTQISSILSQVDKSKGLSKTKKTFKSSLSASGLPSNEKTLKSLKPTTLSSNKAQVSLNSLKSIPPSGFTFNFKPEINKTSQEIAKKLGPSSSRLMAPKVRSSLDSLTTIENHVNLNTLTSVNPLSTFNSQGLNSMSSFNMFNSFTSFQSIPPSQSFNQGTGFSQSNFHQSSELQGKTVKPEEFEVTAKRMFDWNKARLEKLRQNQEARMKLDLEFCTFRPDIGECKDEKKGINVGAEKKENRGELPGGKKLVKAKVGYSGKVIESSSKPIINKAKRFEDLNDIDYDHALKRLHWELESIVLTD